MQMGHVEEKIDLESDEEIPFNSSQTTRKAHNFDFEASQVGSQAIPSTSWVEQMRFRPLRSIYIVLIKAKINVLLPFGPLAILLHYLTGNHVRSTDFTYRFLIHVIPFDWREMRNLRKITLFNYEWRLRTPEVMYGHGKVVNMKMVLIIGNL